MERLFGENLKRLMIERCLSAKELAQLAQVRPCDISKWLAADISRVRLATLGRISRALRIPYDALSFPPNVAGGGGQVKNKFWKWAKNEITGENVLRLDGVIAEESWYDDEISPRQFREELNSCNGDIEIYINSPGGDVFAASQIYTMLMEYKGNVTVKIDGIAASAASVIAMAGTTVAMSPTSNLMIHNPWTVARGDEEEMKTAAKILVEIKESIINAYELKTGLPREKISELMTAETWMNAKKALELGFCDKILYTDDKAESEISIEKMTAEMFSTRRAFNSIIQSFKASEKIDAKNLRRKILLGG